MLRPRPLKERQAPSERRSDRGKKETSINLYSEWKGRAISGETWNRPTDTFTTLKLLNPLHAVPEPHEIHRSPDCEDLKLWKGRSGGTTYLAGRKQMETSYYFLLGPFFVSLRCRKKRILARSSPGSSTPWPLSLFLFLKWLVSEWAGTRELLQR